MYSRRQLADDFRELGVSAGDTLMVHASVRSVGEVAGGPDQIHLALKDAVGADGTLMMYASCPAYYDDVGRGNLTSAQEAEVLEKLPTFDANTARAARDNGTLVEFFRTFPGTRVNQHVARFVVWGKHAEFLISEQPWSYAFGKGSALEGLVRLDGKILLLGSDHDTVTFLHYAEHIVDIADKRVVRYKVPTQVNGERIWRDMEEFDTSAGAHVNWPDRFFAKITDSYLARTRNSGGKVGLAMCYVFSARELLEYALPVMVAVAGNRRAADGLLEFGQAATGRLSR
jgi:aminoglycoside 3-N-acetyltransferase